MRWKIGHEKQDQFDLIHLQNLLMPTEWQNEKQICCIRYIQEVNCCYISGSPSSDSVAGSETVRKPMFPNIFSQRITELREWIHFRGTVARRNSFKIVWLPTEKGSTLKDKNANYFLLELRGLQEKNANSFLLELTYDLFKVDPSKGIFFKRNKCAPLGANSVLLE